MSTTVPVRWRLSFKGPALIISSGLIFYGSKKPRGLSYEDVMTMMLAHPKVGYYEKKILRTVTLLDAVANKLEDIGTKKPMTASIDLYKIKQDRIFKEFPKNGKELIEKVYTSEPRIEKDEDES